MPFKNKLKEYNKTAMKLINEFRETNKVVEAQRIFKPLPKTSIFKTGHHPALSINDEKEKDDNYDIAAFIASITEEALAKDIVTFILITMFDYLFRLY